MGDEIVLFESDDKEISKRTEKSLDSRQVLSVIEKYSEALDMLDSYDHQNMTRPKGNAATYMIAESQPTEMDMMITVVMNCIK